MSLRKRTLPSSAGSLSPAVCTSNVLLGYGKKSLASLSGVSRINERESSSASFSHQAPAVTPGSVRGNLFFQASNTWLDAEVLDCGPTSSVAVTSPLPGRQTRSHSSHETWAFNALAPGGRSSDNTSGTTSSTSS